MQFLLSLTDKSCACTGDFTRLYSFFPANVNWQTAVLYKMGNPGGCSSELEYLWGSKRCSIVAQIDICSCYSFWTLPSVSLSTYISILGQSDRLCFRMVALPPHFFFSDSLDTKSPRQQISWILVCQNVSRLGFHQHDLLQKVWNFCSVHEPSKLRPCCRTETSNVLSDSLQWWTRDLDATR